MSEKGEILNNEEDFDYDDPNQKFFNIADIKPLDLKSHWLGSTHESLKKYETKLQELIEEKKIMQEGFQRFAENESRFRLSSFRKINFVIDKKKLYKEYMESTRKLIEKLHPSLILAIYSYVEDSVFLVMARMRRVSRIFNCIYLNQNVIEFFAEKDFRQPGVSLKVQEQWCYSYLKFVNTLLYYKQIQYTVLIPQNSIKEDLEEAVNFINKIYKTVHQLQSTSIGYFILLNNFMIKHRVVMALESLTFSELAVTRKAAIIAFSNFLAFNPASRIKEEITKTKYLKMIEMVEDEDYRDSLVINSKISNFVLEEYQYELAVFIDTFRNAPSLDMSTPGFYDVVVYRYGIELRSFLVKDARLENLRVEAKDTSVEFSENFSHCTIGFEESGRYESIQIEKYYMPAVFANCEFGHCYIYRCEEYYILLLKREEKEVEVE